MIFTSQSLTAALFPHMDVCCQSVSVPFRPKITFQDVPDQFAYQFEFSAPRNHLLAIVAHYLSSSNARIRHLSKFLGDLATRPPELLDAKSHVRLADVAHTLLKVAAYNKEVMACEGLELYMMEILPAVDFSVESLKAALQNLLRRIEKTFTKISKASSMRKETDWYVLYDRFCSYVSFSCVTRIWQGCCRFFISFLRFPVTYRKMGWLISCLFYNLSSYLFSRYYCHLFPPLEPCFRKK